MIVNDWNGTYRIRKDGELDRRYKASKKAPKPVVMKDRELRRYRIKVLLFLITIVVYGITAFRFEIREYIQKVQHDRVFGVTTRLDANE